MCDCQKNPSSGGGVCGCAGGFCSEKKIQTRMVEPDKLIFIVEWFDREAELIKKYCLSYYTIDGTIDIADLVKKNRFLKRMKVDTVTLETLYIGNVLNIYARHMTITEYGDSCTRQYLEPKAERAFLMVKPEAVHYLGYILQRIEKCFRVIRANMAKMEFEMARRFYEQHEGQDYHAKLIQHISSAPVLAFLVVGPNAIEKMKNLVGETDPASARLKNPTCLRALYGKDVLHNGFHTSESPGCVIKDSSFFFANCRQELVCIAQNTAILNCTTCCIIKPHAVKEGLSGRIISDIVAANFRVTAIQLFYLDRTHGEEFYEIYKGVLGEYSEMTSEIALGPCYVLEISGCSQETPQAFRSAVGPADPEIGRKLRPQSLRARYGIDKVHNAIHCTDLPEDAHQEVEYFFRILQMKS